MAPLAKRYLQSKGLNSQSNLNFKKNSIVRCHLCISVFFFPLLQLVQLLLEALLLGQDHSNDVLRSKSTLLIKFVLTSERTTAACPKDHKEKHRSFLCKLQINAKNNEGNNRGRGKLSMSSLKISPGAEFMNVQSLWGFWA